MPPTISVTVGRLDAAAAFCPVAEPLADELPELLQAARPAARTPTLAAAAIALREGLNMRLLLFSVWSDELELVTDGELRRRRLRSGPAAARTAGAVPAGRSGLRRSAPGPR